MNMPDAHRGQQRELYPLELELRRVLHCHVGAKNQTQVLRKSIKCSYNH